MVVIVQIQKNSEVSRGGGGLKGHGKHNLHDLSTGWVGNGV